jgi:NTE family protein
MNVNVDPSFAIGKRHLPFETVALVLQGGGALGAYQAGVYEALAEADIHPNWIAGISDRSDQRSHCRRQSSGFAH